MRSTKYLMCIHVNSACCWHCQCQHDNAFNWRRLLRSYAGYSRFMQRACILISLHTTYATYTADGKLTSMTTDSRLSRCWMQGSLLPSQQPLMLLKAQRRQSDPPFCTLRRYSRACHSTYQKPDHEAWESSRWFRILYRDSRSAATHVTTPRTCWSIDARK